MYSDYKENPDQIENPVVALFTPHNLAKLLAEEQTIHEYSRFVLDEIHERSVETDVITALLAQKLHRSNVSLHLLMMTATPDIRIIKLFEGTNFKKFELEDSLLFPIEDIKIQVQDFKQIDETAKDEAIKIIQRMDSKEVKRGHILIFTSGNRRINNVIDLIRREIKTLPKSIKLVNIHEKLMKVQSTFYSFLDKEIQDDDSLYILLMKYAGFLKAGEKEIRKNPIPNHPNVVKIIVATNAIESSITIDGLAAVIDCGIFNQPILDIERGISKLEENPISKQSQTQRRGRVGRKMEGICVQLTVKNHPPVELVSPAIEKEDISLSILSLRKIRIYLEKIKNLPEPGVDSRKMRNYLNELKSFGAIDKDGNLTDKGSQLDYFSPLLPFVSTSILEVSQNIRGDVKMVQIVGSLIFLILSTKDLIVDNLSKDFRDNFDPDSDIMTILNTLIEIMKRE